MDLKGWQDYATELQATLETTREELALLKDDTHAKGSASTYARASMMTLEDIANGIGNADRQGADHDEPEGARYITLSETLVLRMVFGLGGVRGGIVMLEEKNAELVAVVEALEHRLGDPE